MKVLAQQPQKNEMILGVYWYFEFPTDLYHYKYFEYTNGRGGHAYNPAELSTTVKVANPETLIQGLFDLANENIDSRIFAYVSDDNVEINIGGYLIHDYEFELALQVEKILEKSNAIINGKSDIGKAELIKIENKYSKLITGHSTDFFQVVGSPIRKYGAETASLRFDCNLENSKKEKYFEELKDIAKSVNINVIHYLDQKHSERVDLMLFFTNGRQGKSLIPKQRVNVIEFEVKLKALNKRYNVNKGFIGYPIGKHKALMIVDKELILE